MTSTHAEMAVTTMWKSTLIHDTVDLYVLRFNKTGNMVESRPCKHCVEQLAKCHIPIRNIYWSTADGTIIHEQLRELYYEQCHYVTSAERRRYKK